jgi:putative zinc finger/helix-turn-helix YgiT family protein
MKASPRRCVSCRERAVSPTVLPTYTTELEHDGRTYTVSVKELRVQQCEHCKAIVLDDDANAAISAALRHEAGLLSPEEIRANRERLGLSQRQLAQCLRISESTLSRWSTGAQIQQRAMDALLRVFFESAEARSILRGHPGVAACCGQSHGGSATIWNEPKPLNISADTLHLSGASRLVGAFDGQSTDRTDKVHLQLQKHSTPLGPSTPRKGDDGGEKPRGAN